MWHGWVTRSSFFVSCFLRGLGFAWAWAFPSSIQPLSSLWVGWHFCHATSLPLPCCILVCACWASFGLAAHFPFYSVHVAQYYYWACSHTILGFLGLFYSFGHPWPASFLWASSAYSNPSFPWVFAKSFKLSRPNYHILYFRGLLAFLPTPFTNSFIWAPLAYFCLIFIFHNSHGFTTSFFGLPWARLFSLGPFDYLTGPWTIIPTIWVQWFSSHFANSSPLLSPIFLGFFLLLSLLAKVGINTNQQGEREGQWKPISIF